jgi:hypothetical protein
LGLTGCDKEVDIKELEQSLVGIWWDAYEYSDITETGVAFDKVLLAVKADANHSGCLYLGAYDSKSDALVAVYGGPEDAGFKWELTGKGDIVLSDPATGESTVLTRADGGSSYGNDMTNVNGTNMTYTNGSVTVTNGNYSGTLTKADTGKEGEINEQFSALFSAIATNLSSEDNIRIKDTPGNTWGR